MVQKAFFHCGRKTAFYVIAQNAETCVVYGMPKAIVETGVVNEVAPLTQVAQEIIKNVGYSKMDVSQYLEIFIDETK